MNFFSSEFLKKTLTVLTWILLGVTVAVLASNAFASESEDIFKKAERYTVQIKTQVTTAFLGDEKGSFKGTGFVVDLERGWIITNAHVASRSPSTIRVAFKDGSYVAARKVYVDPLIDIAIISIPVDGIPKGVHAASLECDVATVSGHPVGAYGHPWGISYTATRGIISGDTYKRGESWLQTDAPINKGNSGGPLISLVTGKVVGVSSAMLNEDSAQRLNFAVPMEYGCRIVDLLSKGHDPSPPKIPVVFYKNEEEQKPLTIAAVYSDHAFPLKAGDEILKVDGHAVLAKNPAMLAHLLRGKYAAPAPFEIRRDGVVKTIKVPLTPLSGVMNRTGILVSGMLISYTDFIDQEEFNMGKALMIHAIEEGSQAESLGFEKWDLIRSVDGKSFDNLQSLYTYLNEQSSGKEKVQLVVKKLELSNGSLYGYRNQKISIEQLKLIAEENESES